MIITKVNMRLKEGSRLKAVVSLCIEDRYWLNDIKLVLCNDGMLKAEFPKLDDNRFFFMPVSQEARADLEGKIVAEYRKQKTKAEALPLLPKDSNDTRRVEI